MARPARGRAAGGAGRSALPARGGAPDAGLTWLNPNVYLDTVVLIGSIANAHGPSGRWWFAAGAGLASALWFISLGYGARLLAPLLATARAWQVLDLLIAATMLLIAVRLALI
jgi:L-lysine exporter family protein LysE/ArgO